MWLCSMEKYDWNNYLNFSVQILTNNKNDKKYDDETICRVAISRAYYAAYNTAKKFLNSNKNFDTKIGLGSHDSLILAYKEIKKGDNSFKTTCKTIGNILYSLKDFRVDVDYNEKCKNNINYSTAKNICKKAEKLIEKINDLA